MIFKKIILLIFLIFLSCDLPTEQIVYEKNPVVFGYIDAGFNRIESIHLSWSNNFSNSHINNSNYIENAQIKISTVGNNPDYQDIHFDYFEKGEYQVSSSENIQITPGSQWNLEINFSDEDKDYILTSSTIIPDPINLTTTDSDIDWNCNGFPLSITADFNLYQTENNIDSDLNGTPDLIQDWLDSGDLSFLDNIQQVDNIIYNTQDCYTSSFASVPFFTIDLGSDDENILAKYTTIALEPDKDMNLDGNNIPFEAAIFDTTLSANAFKGPMNYHPEWGWYRDTIDRINLTGNIIDIMWLFFDYYGINMMLVQPMGEDYKKYYESDPDQFSFPYILRQTNIESNQGDAYGLFYSTNSEFFFFNVLPEEDLSTPE